MFSIELRKKYMKEVLFISPGNKNSKGGIGLCVNNYSKFMSPFKVLVTNPFSSKLLNAIWFPVCIMELVVKLLLDSEIKIIHIHGASKGSFYRKYILFSVVSRFFNKKTIYHIHGGGFKDFYSTAPQFIQRRIKLMIEKVDCLICLSERWKQFFTDTFKPKRIMILNNMIIPPEKPNEIDKAEELHLLFLGLIGDNKGIFDLLDCIAENREIFEHKMILKIAGNGDTERLEKKIEELRIENLIHFVGWVDAEKKDQLLRSCHVFILPSYKEGLPLSILEAMSYSLPIISSYAGGIPELIQKYENGILVNAGNKEEIKKAMMTLLNDHALIHNYSKKSRAGAKDYYPEIVLKTLFSIYHEIQESKGLLAEQN